MFKISVTNRQHIDDRQDTVNETAEGSLYIRNGKKYIIYRAETENGTEACTIISDGGRVTVKRSGGTSSVMTFDRSRRTRTLYRMPYGSMFMDIETAKIVDALSESGGQLRLVYTIMLQGQEIYNDMSIVVG